MASKRSRHDPKTWRKSKWSALGWGVHCKSLLPCNPERCRYNERRQCEYPPGDGNACPHEVAYFFEYLNGYSLQFKRAHYTLGRAAFSRLLFDLAMTEIQLLRLGLRENWVSLHARALVAEDPEWLMHETTLTTRYERTTRNRWRALVGALSEAARDPYEGMADWERVMHLQDRVAALEAEGDESHDSTR